MATLGFRELSAYKKIITYISDIFKDVVIETIFWKRYKIGPVHVLPDAFC